ncbi:sugar dehydrogenase complex small subunit [Aquirhabdus parva]|uniref:Twin-arginine translocation pathway signal n=1 Tax=Aquirhabdus parva TaxID=2283318 RepID=A0A345P821_9GAMM|nr:sugar dehydrogenase complex small subunit [Aquirhabdus parva]AXI03430.1 hypothetical protein HYN46_11630 [Aquirhabdus parva]
MKKNDASGDAENTHDIAPSSLEPKLNRRQWLQATLLLVVGGLSGSVTLQSLAESTNTDGLSAFMTLSKALTERQQLDPEVGQRFLTAFTQNNLSFQSQLQPLSAALAGGTLDAAQQELALQILEAWYLGTVNKQVITYEQALMFTVASDILVIRSYCLNKPGFWAEKPATRSV